MITEEDFIHDTANQLTIAIGNVRCAIRKLDNNTPAAGSLLEAKQALHKAAALLAGRKLVLNRKHREAR